MTDRIIVFGSLNVDTALDVRRRPRWGETVLARGSAVAAGGKGANQAVAARRLGAPVRMVGRIGRDAGGDLLRASLAADGVDDGLIVDPEQGTGSAVILRGPGGRNAIIVSAGANGAVRIEDLGGLAADGGPAILVLQLEIPLAATEAAARLGRARGWHILLNAAPAPTLGDALLADVDTLVANELEAAQLSGLPVRDAESAVAAAGVLRSRGALVVAVTLGALGAVLVSDRGSWFAPAPRVDVVDTTAAGDAFVGALAVGISEGRSAADALGFAVAAGSLAVTRAGAQPSLPGRADTAALARTVSLVSLAGGA